MTKILVPLDGSASSERILTIVRRFATMMDAEVIFVRVLDQRDAVNRGAAARQDAEEHLHTVLDQGFPSGHTIVHEASTAVRGVLDVIAAEQADLVIMATHGSNCAREQPMGSVARDLVRTSAVPVMLVGLAAVQPPSDALAASSHN